MPSALSNQATAPILPTLQMGLVILDESFASLDPENLKRSLECVKKRAKSLLVIAHR
jgi:ABC-type molybdenum transport system ATPase subunit/photorepair protein PhrA